MKSRQANLSGSLKSHTTHWTLHISQLHISHKSTAHLTMSNADLQEENTLFQALTTIVISTIEK